MSDCAECDTSTAVPAKSCAACGLTDIPGHEPWHVRTDAPGRVPYLVPDPDRESGEPVRRAGALPRTLATVATAALGAGALVVVTVAGVVSWLSSPDSSADSGGIVAAVPSMFPGSGPDTSPDLIAGTPVGDESDDGSAPAPPSSGARYLSERAERDRPAAASLTGAWVPQISSKRSGMTVNGTVYDDVAIAEHVAELTEHYPGALLVRSSDYASFTAPGLWVVLVDASFPEAEGANAWCDAAGLGPDDCFAKRLAQDGPSGNTVHR